MTTLRLGALLCSKLCHDLVGPIGALGNGVEILSEEEDKDMQARALALLGESVEAAACKLRFFRLAFGGAETMGPVVPWAEVRRTADEFFAKGRIAIEWPQPIDASQTLDKAVAKLLLNLVLFGADTLPRGGTIKVDLGPGQLGIAAEGTGARLDAELQAALQDKLDEAQFDSRTVVASHLAALAEAQGATLAFRGPDDARVEITVGPVRSL